MEQIRILRNQVIELIQNSPGFRHQGWFVKYHLDIVEKISLELCDFYPSASRDVVLAMVWMHDYGKIIDFDHEHETTLSAGRNFLAKLSFAPNFISQILSYIELLDKKVALHSDSTPIEVKIVSSADGAAHLVGPFFQLWWHENPTKHFEELMADNVQKLDKDWSYKIVLPEVAEAFSARRAFVLEQCGKFPERFLTRRSSLLG